MSELPRVTAELEPLRATIERLGRRLQLAEDAWALALAVLEDNCAPVVPDHVRDLIRVERRRRDNYTAWIQDGQPPLPTGG